MTLMNMRLNKLDLLVFFAYVEMQKIENKNNRNDSDFVFSSPIDSNKDADGYQISLFTGDADTVFNNNIMTIGPFKTKYARSI